MTDESFMQLMRLLPRSALSHAVGHATRFPAPAWLHQAVIRRFAEDPTTGRQYSANTMLILRLTLRTVADFGFRAL